MSDFLCLFSVIICYFPQIFNNCFVFIRRKLYSYLVLYTKDDRARLPILLAQTCARMHTHTSRSADLFAPQRRPGQRQLSEHVSGVTASVAQVKCSDNSRSVSPSTRGIEYTFDYVVKRDLFYSGQI